MKISKFIKSKIKVFINRATMFFEFYQDYKDYKKWNYNNPVVKTCAAQESKMLRQTHMIEKGLSLSNPRKGFGLAKIEELFRMLDDYIELGFPTDNVPFQNSLTVLDEYVKIQHDMGYDNSELNTKISKYEKYASSSFDAGIKHGTKDEILSLSSSSSYPDFFLSRHSMRQFSDIKVAISDIEKAVSLAQKAPTACNRQACKVYYYESEEINKKLGELISGNTGFDNEVKNYLVITADLSAFYDTFERNQIYIEAGLFSMALIEALHYYGIASCALQNGEYKKKNRKFKNICGNIPENEKITLFIAIGYYKDEFNYAVSKRKNLPQVLIRK